MHQCCSFVTVIRRTRVHMLENYTKVGLRGMPGGSYESINGWGWHFTNWSSNISEQAGLWLREGSLGDWTQPDLQLVQLVHHADECISANSCAEVPLSCDHPKVSRQKGGSLGEGTYAILVETTNARSTAGIVRVKWEGLTAYQRVAKQGKHHCIDIYDNNDMTYTTCSWNCRACQPPWFAAYWALMHWQWLNTNQLFCDTSH